MEQTNKQTKKIIFKSFKSPASGKENVRFPDSPDFEKLPDFQTRRDVWQSPNLKVDKRGHGIESSLRGSLLAELFPKDTLTYWLI